MRVLLNVLFVGFIGMLVVPSLAEAGCSSRRNIRRVYVIRRNLQMPKGFKYCALAHSGLILEMSDGKHCVLEYMGDGKAHLYDANPTSSSNCWFGRHCVKLTMRDDSGSTYKWTRQMFGTSITGYSKARISPQKAQQQMQSLMGSNYSLVNNNCHLGQERLRRSWGMSVSQPYRPRLNGICSCNLPSYLPGTLGLFKAAVSAYCGRLG